MNTRLVWNFEISHHNVLNLNELNDSREELRWEARYFWPQTEIICLNGLDERFLALSNYEVKQRQDCYYLLKDANLNIKQRREELVYKPILQEKEGLIGVSKKINLEDYPCELRLPGCKNLNSTELLAQLKNNSNSLKVVKEALLYKFQSKPTIKLELSRLTIAKRIYFSLCVEGRSFFLVKTIARHLLPSEVSCDYVNFLTKILSHGY